MVILGRLQSLDEKERNLRELETPLPAGIKVAASDVGLAREFLTPHVERLVTDLDSFGRLVRIVFGESFKVVAAPETDSETLGRFVSLCLQLAQQARVFASRDGSVKVLAESASAPGLCQICGADLEGDLVACARCATRHHRDCWEYTGICSTYGCGEREATKA